MLRTFTVAVKNFSLYNSNYQVLYRHGKAQHASNKNQRKQYLLKVASQI